MIDLEILKRRGCSPEAWQRIFTKPENSLPVYNPWKQQDNVLAPDYDKITGEYTKLEAVGEGIGTFRNRIRMRIMEGREWNFKNYKIYKGLDDALDVPLTRAVTPTLLSWFCNEAAATESLKKELR